MVQGYTSRIPTSADFPSVTGQNLEGRVSKAHIRSCFDVADEGLGRANAKEEAGVLRLRHNEDILSVEYKGCFMVDLTAASQEFGGWRTFWFVIAEACPIASREAIAIADRDVVSWIGEKREVDQVAELSK